MKLSKATAPSQSAARERTVALWALRVTALALPASAASFAFSPAAEILAWSAWSVVVFSAFYRHPLGLVVLRVLPPAGLVLAIAGASELLALHLALVIALGFTNLIGTEMVNGPAYPNEHRELLRPAAAVLLGPLQLAWLAAVVPLVATGAALQSERWLTAAAGAGLGGPLTFFALRSMYGLACRWLVFVPAGVVLHDGMVLADPVLFQRQLIERLEPAPRGSDVLDLTLGAWGLALQLSLHEKVPMVLRANLEAGSSARLLFTPSRAGAVLTLSHERSVGVPKPVQTPS